MKSMITSVLLVAKLLLVFAVGLLSIPFMAIFSWHTEWFNKVRFAVYRFGTWVLGFSVVVNGSVSQERPMLYVSNHSTYMDIMVLGSVLPGSFIAKEEVKTWPIFGWMGRFNKTIFINRNAMRSLGELNKIRKQLVSGEALILFPEGTTNNGNAILPFKSAAFKITEEEDLGFDLAIQPVTISYTHINGEHTSFEERTTMSWFDDIDMVPHMWRFLRMGNITVQVDLHPVRILDGPARRKEIAQWCYESVNEAFKKVIAQTKELENVDDLSLPPPQATHYRI